ncbi:MAG: M20/M25/M40 family metallo-hydrolase [Thermoleophilaceae bacterium]|nr:M20/M25/M40 family metallo-hydrolase [Thermoleophilaceae bacterium]
MDERDLAVALIGYETSDHSGITKAAGFIKGWLESHEFQVEEFDVAGLPVLVAETRGEGPTVVLHGHIDVVPGKAHQFVPQVDGDRLVGRGAYDMKGGLAAMMCAFRDLRDEPNVKTRFLCVADEESEQMGIRGTYELVRRGYGGDFAITGEPTDLHVGVQAKGVLALRVSVSGRAAHGSTPWLGDNAVLKAIDVLRAIESLPFTRQSSELFDRPSINLGRIEGGDAINKVPDTCVMDIDIRYVPGQDPQAILAAVRAIDETEVEVVFEREPAYVSREDPFVKQLIESLISCGEGDKTAVGRDGSSEATAFLEAGIPAVEFGPTGGGHHGPDEWVSIASLAAYRQSLVSFARAVGGELQRNRMRAV